MRRTIIGGAVLGASLLLGAGPALACGHPTHSHHGGGESKHHRHSHKPAHHKPRHEHHGKPCVCQKPKPAPHHPHHGRHHHKPIVGPPRPHPRPPVVTPPVVTHQRAKTLPVVSHNVSYAGPASLPRTGGTPWVLIFAGTTALGWGVAIKMALPLRKASERAS